MEILYDYTEPCIQPDINIQADCYVKKLSNGYKMKILERKIGKDLVFPTEIFISNGRDDYYRGSDVENSKFRFDEYPVVVGIYDDCVKDIKKDHFKFLVALKWFCRDLNQDELSEIYAIVDHASTDGTFEFKAKCPEVLKQ